MGSNQIGAALGGFKIPDVADCFPQLLNPQILSKAQEVTGKEQ